MCWPGGVAAGMRTLAVKSPPPGGAGNLPTGWAASLSSQKITSLAPPASVFTLSWLDGGAQERPSHSCTENS